MLSHYGCSLSHPYCFYTDVNSIWMLYLSGGCLYMDVVLFRKDLVGFNCPEVLDKIELRLASGTRSRDLFDRHHFLRDCCSDGLFLQNGLQWCGPVPGATRGGRGQIPGALGSAMVLRKVKSFHLCKRVQEFKFISPIESLSRLGSECSAPCGPDFFDSDWTITRRSLYPPIGELPHQSSLPAAWYLWGRSYISYCSSSMFYINYRS